jgi:hypothetical protein
MSGEDVFTALKELGFDKYEEELREFMKNYNAEKEDAVARSKNKKRAAEQVEEAEQIIDTSDKRVKFAQQN